MSEQSGKLGAEAAGSHLQKQDGGKIEFRDATNLGIEEKMQLAEVMVGVPVTSSEFQLHMLPSIVKTYRDVRSVDRHTYSGVYVVQNHTLLNRFQEVKREWQAAGYSEEELTESYAFLYTNTEEEAREICRVGVSVGNVPSRSIGHPGKGVHLCRHADVLQPRPLLDGSTHYMVICKLIKGRNMVVNMPGGLEASDCLEPTPGYDSTTASPDNTHWDSLTPEQLFTYTQMYVYERRGHLMCERPRQACPVAVVKFQYRDIRQPTAVHVPRWHAATTQPSPPRASDHVVCSGQPSPPRARDHVVWSGQLSIRGLFACPVQMLSHTDMDKPATLGSHMNITCKIGMRDGQEKYLRTVPGLFPHTEAYWNGWYYNVCRLQPLLATTNFDKFINYLEKNDSMAVMKMEEDVLLLTVDSDMTRKLGLAQTHRDSGHSRQLHCIVMSRQSRKHKRACVADSRSQVPVQSVSLLQMSHSPLREITNNSASKQRSPHLTCRSSTYVYKSDEDRETNNESPVIPSMSFPVFVSQSSVSPCHNDHLDASPDVSFTFSSMDSNTSLEIPGSPGHVQLSPGSEASQRAAVSRLYQMIPFPGLAENQFESHVTCDRVVRGQQGMTGDNSTLARLLMVEAEASSSTDEDGCNLASIKPFQPPPEYSSRLTEALTISSQDHSTKYTETHDHSTKYTETQDHSTKYTETQGNSPPRSTQDQLFDDLSLAVKQELTSGEVLYPSLTAPPADKVVASDVSACLILPGATLHGHTKSSVPLLERLTMEFRRSPSLKDGRTKTAGTDDNSSSSVASRLSESPLHQTTAAAMIHTLCSPTPTKHRGIAYTRGNPLLPYSTDVPLCLSTKPIQSSQYLQFPFSPRPAVTLGSPSPTPDPVPSAPCAHTGRLLSPEAATQGGGDSVECSEPGPSTRHGMVQNMEPGGRTERCPVPELAATCERTDASRVSRDQSPQPLPLDLSVCHRNLVPHAFDSGFLLEPPAGSLLQYVRVKDCFANQQYINSASVEPKPTSDVYVDSGKSSNRDSGVQNVAETTLDVDEPTSSSKYHTGSSHSASVEPKPTSDVYVDSGKSSNRDTGVQKVAETTLDVDEESENEDPLYRIVQEDTVTKPTSSCKYHIGSSHTTPDHIKIRLKLDKHSKATNECRDTPVTKKGQKTPKKVRSKCKDKDDKGINSTCPKSDNIQDNSVTDVQQRTDSEVEKKIKSEPFVVNNSLLGNRSDKICSVRLQDIMLVRSSKVDKHLAKPTPHNLGRNEMDSHTAHIEVKTTGKAERAEDGKPKVAFPETKSPLVSPSQSMHSERSHSHQHKAKKKKHKSGSEKVLHSEKLSDGKYTPSKTKACSDFDGRERKRHKSLSVVEVRHKHHKSHDVAESATHMKIHTSRHKHKSEKKRSKSGGVSRGEHKLVVLKEKDTNCHLTVDNNASIGDNNVSSVTSTESVLHETPIQTHIIAQDENTPSGVESNASDKAVVKKVRSPSEELAELINDIRKKRMKDDTTPGKTKAETTKRRWEHEEPGTVKKVKVEYKTGVKKEKETREKHDKDRKHKKTPSKSTWSDKVLSQVMGTGTGLHSMGRIPKKKPLHPTPSPGDGDIHRNHIPHKHKSKSSDLARSDGNHMAATPSQSVVSPSDEITGLSVADSDNESETNVEQEDIKDGILHTECVRNMSMELTESPLYRKSRSNTVPENNKASIKESDVQREMEKSNPVFESVLNPITNRCGIPGLGGFSPQGFTLSQRLAQNAGETKTVEPQRTVEKKTDATLCITVSGIDSHGRHAADGQEENGVVSMETLKTGLHGVAASSPALPQSAVVLSNTVRCSLHGFSRTLGNRSCVAFDDNHGRARYSITVDVFPRDEKEEITDNNGSKSEGRTKSKQAIGFDSVSSALDSIVNSAKMKGSKDKHTKPDLILNIPMITYSIVDKEHDDELITLSDVNEDAMIRSDSASEKVNTSRSSSNEVMEPVGTEASTPGAVQSDETCTINREPTPAVLPESCLGDVAESCLGDVADATQDETNSSEKMLPKDSSPDGSAVQKPRSDKSAEKDPQKSEPVEITPDKKVTDDDNPASTKPDDKKEGYVLFSKGFSLSLSGDKDSKNQTAASIESVRKSESSMETKSIRRRRSSEKDASSKDDTRTVKVGEESKSGKKDNRSSRSRSRSKEPSKDSIDKRLVQLSKRPSSKEETQRGDSRHSRQFHPYRKEAKRSPTRRRRNVPSWSFDMAYRDMNELLQNLTTNSFRQQNRRPLEVLRHDNRKAQRFSRGQSSGNARRFSGYRFSRSEIPRRLPRSQSPSSSDSEEESKAVTPDVIPNMEERVKTADMLDNMFMENKEEEGFTVEQSAYDEEQADEASDRRCVTVNLPDKTASENMEPKPSADVKNPKSQTKRHLGSPLIIPGGPKTFTYSSCVIDHENEASMELVENTDTRLVECNEKGGSKDKINIADMTPCKEVKFDSSKTPQENNHAKVVALSSNNRDIKGVDSNTKAADKTEPGQDKTEDNANGAGRQLLSSESDTNLDYIDEEAALDNVAFLPAIAESSDEFSDAGHGQTYIVVDTFGESDSDFSITGCKKNNEVPEKNGNCKNNELPGVGMSEPKSDVSEFMKLVADAQENMVLDSENYTVIDETYDDETLPTVDETHENTLQTVDESASEEANEADKYQIAPGVNRETYTADKEPCANPVTIMASDADEVFISNTLVNSEKAASENSIDITSTQTNNLENMYVASEIVCDEIVLTEPIGSGAVLFADSSIEVCDTTEVVSEDNIVIPGVQDVPEKTSEELNLPKRNKSNINSEKETTLTSLIHHCEIENNELTKCNNLTNGTNTTDSFVTETGQLAIVYRERNIENDNKSTVEEKEVFCNEEIQFTVEEVVESNTGYEGQGTTCSEHPDSRSDHLQDLQKAINSGIHDNGVCCVSSCTVLSSDKKPGNSTVNTDTLIIGEILSGLDSPEHDCNRAEKDNKVSDSCQAPQSTWRDMVSKSDQRDVHACGKADSDTAVYRHSTDEHVTADDRQCNFKADIGKYTFVETNFDPSKGGSSNSVQSMSLQENTIICDTTQGSPGIVLGSSDDEMDILEKAAMEIHTTPTCPENDLVLSCLLKRHASESGTPAPRTEAACFSKTSNQNHSLSSMPSQHSQIICSEVNSGFHNLEPCYTTNCNNELPPISSPVTMCLESNALHPASCLVSPLLQTPPSMSPILRFNPCRAASPTSFYGYSRCMPLLSGPHGLPSGYPPYIPPPHFMPRTNAYMFQHPSPHMYQSHRPYLYGGHTSFVHQNRSPNERSCSPNRFRHAANLATASEIHPWMMSGDNMGSFLMNRPNTFWLQAFYHQPTVSVAKIATREEKSKQANNKSTTHNLNMKTAIDLPMSLANICEQSIQKSNTHAECMLVPTYPPQETTNYMPKTLKHLCQQNVQMTYRRHHDQVIKNKLVLADSKGRKSESNMPNSLKQLCEQVVTNTTNQQIKVPDSTYRELARCRPIGEHYVSRFHQMSDSNQAKNLQPGTVIDDPTSSLAQKVNIISTTNTKTDLPKTCSSLQLDKFAMIWNGIPVCSSPLKENYAEIIEADKPLAFDTAKMLKKTRTQTDNSNTKVSSTSTVEMFPRSSNESVQCRHTPKKTCYPVKDIEYSMFDKIDHLNGETAKMSQQYEFQKNKLVEAGPSNQKMSTNGIELKNKNTTVVTHSVQETTLGLNRTVETLKQLDMEQTPAPSALEVEMSLFYKELSEVEDDDILHKPPIIKSESSSIEKKLVTKILSSSGTKPKECSILNEISKHESVLEKVDSNADSTTPGGAHMLNLTCETADNAKTKVEPSNMLKVASIMDSKIKTSLQVQRKKNTVNMSVTNTDNIGSNITIGLNNISDRFDRSPEGVAKVNKCTGSLEIQIGQMDKTLRKKACTLEAESDDTDEKLTKTAHTLQAKSGDIHKTVMKSETIVKVLPKLLQAMGTDRNAETKSEKVGNNPCENGESSVINNSFEAEVTLLYGELLKESDIVHSEDHSNSTVVGKNMTTEQIESKSLMDSTIRVTDKNINLNMSSETLICKCPDIQVTCKNTGDPYKDMSSEASCAKVVDLNTGHNALEKTTEKVDLQKESLSNRKMSVTSEDSRLEDSGDGVLHDQLLSSNIKKICRPSKIDNKGISAELVSTVMPVNSLNNVKPASCPGVGSSENHLKKNTVEKTTNASHPTVPVYNTAQCNPLRMEREKLLTDKSASKKDMPKKVYSLEMNNSIEEHVPAKCDNNKQIHVVNSIGGTSKKEHVKFSQPEHDLKSNISVPGKKPSKLDLELSLFYSELSKDEQNESQQNAPYSSIVHAITNNQELHNLKQRGSSALDLVHDSYSEDGSTLGVKDCNDQPHVPLSKLVDYNEDSMEHTDGAFSTDSSPVSERKSVCKRVDTLATPIIKDTENVPQPLDKDVTESKVSDDNAKLVAIADSCSDSDVAAHLGNKGKSNIVVYQVYEDCQNKPQLPSPSLVDASKGFEAEMADTEVGENVPSAINRCIKDVSISIRSQSEDDNVHLHSKISLPSSRKYEYLKVGIVDMLAVTNKKREANICSDTNNALNKGEFETIREAVGKIGSSIEVVDQKKSSFDTQSDTAETKMKNYALECLSDYPISDDEFDYSNKTIQTVSGSLCITETPESKLNENSNLEDKSISKDLHTIVSQPIVQYDSSLAALAHYSGNESESGDSDQTIMPESKQKVVARNVSAVGKNEDAVAAAFQADKLFRCKWTDQYESTGSESLSNSSSVTSDSESTDESTYYSSTAFGTDFSNAVEYSKPGSNSDNSSRCETQIDVNACSKTLCAPVSSKKVTSEQIYRRKHSLSTSEEGSDIERMERRHLRQRLKGNKSCKIEGKITDSLCSPSSSSNIEKYNVPLMSLDRFSSSSNLSQCSIAKLIEKRKLLAQELLNEQTGDSCSDKDIPSSDTKPPVEMDDSQYYPFLMGSTISLPGEHTGEIHDHSAVPTEINKSNLASFSDSKNKKESLVFPINKERATHDWVKQVVEGMNDSKTTECRELQDCSGSSSKPSENVDNSLNNKTTVISKLSSKTGTNSYENLKEYLPVQSIVNKSESVISNSQHNVRTSSGSAVGSPSENSRTKNSRNRTSSGSSRFSFVTIDNCNSSSSRGVSNNEIPAVKYPLRKSSTPASKKGRHNYLPRSSSSDSNSPYDRCSSERQRVDTGRYRASSRDNERTSSSRSRSSSLSSSPSSSSYRSRDSTKSRSDSQSNSNPQHFRMSSRHLNAHHPGHRHHSNSESDSGKFRSSPISNRSPSIPHVSRSRDLETSHRRQSNTKYTHSKFSNQNITRKSYRKEGSASPPNGRDKKSIIGKRNVPPSTGKLRNTSPVANVGLRSISWRERSISPNPQRPRESDLKGKSSPSKRERKRTTLGRRWFNSPRDMLETSPHDTNKCQRTTHCKASNSKWQRSCDKTNECTRSSDKRASATADSYATSLINKCRVRPLSQTIAKGSQRSRSRSPDLNSSSKKNITSRASGSTQDAAIDQRPEHLVFLHDAVFSCWTHVQLERLLKSVAQFSTQYCWWKVMVTSTQICKLAMECKENGEAEDMLESLSTYRERGHMEMISHGPCQLVTLAREQIHSRPGVRNVYIITGNIDMPVTDGCPVLCSLEQFLDRHVSSR